MLLVEPCQIYFPIQVALIALLESKPHAELRSIRKSRDTNSMDTFFVVLSKR